MYRRGICLSEPSHGSPARVFYGPGLVIVIFAILLVPSSPVGSWAREVPRLPSSGHGFTPLGNTSTPNGTASAAAPTIPLPPHWPPVANTSNWPTYEFAANRSGYNTGENTLSPENASQLRVVWNKSLSGPVFGSPTAVNGTVYVGSWDGYEYALSAATGAQKWRTFLGVESFPNSTYGCSWINPLGVTSSAAVYNNSVYVGGFHNYYKLNASTGHIDANFSTDPNSSGNVSDGYYAWSSPLFYHGHLYVGVASQCDHPLVAGGVYELNITASNLTPLHHLLANPGEGGSDGSVWSSPTLDSANNTLWITTGNSNTGWRFAQSIVALNATTFNNTTVEGYWVATHGVDEDFGAGATLISDGSGHDYALATNKDGTAYAVNRSALSAGSVWSDRITTYQHPACQPPGIAVSPAAFDGHFAYLGGAYANLSGAWHSGSVSSVYPSNGTYRWRTATNGSVQAGIAAADGLVVDASRLYSYTWTGSCPITWWSTPNSWLQVLNASTGQQLYSFYTHYIFAGSPAISDGRIFVGAGINDTADWTSLPNHSGHVYAFGIPILSGLSTLTGPYSVQTSGGTVDGHANVSGGMPTFNYTWNWGDSSPLSYGRSPTHNYTSNGTFFANVTILDAGGESSSQYWAVYNKAYSCGYGQFCWTTGITKCGGGLFPISCFQASLTSPISLGASFNGVQPITWQWSFGDGSPQSTSQFPSHQYAEHGTYTVTVTATDANNIQATVTLRVTV